MGIFKYVEYLWKIVFLSGRTYFSLHNFGGTQWMFWVMNERCHTYDALYCKKEVKSSGRCWEYASGYLDISVKHFWYFGHKNKGVLWMVWSSTCQKSVERVFLTMHVHVSGNIFSEEIVQRLKGSQDWIGRCTFILIKSSSSNNVPF